MLIEMMGIIFVVWFSFSLYEQSIDKRARAIYGGVALYPPASAHKTAVPQPHLHPTHAQTRLGQPGSVSSDDAHLSLDPRRMQPAQYRTREEWFLDPIGEFPPGPLYVRTVL